MTVPPETLKLYFDANALRLFQSQSARRGDDVRAVNALFERRERGQIECITSSFTRLEMLNFAKRAAYAVQELDAGRVDVDKILGEIRDKPLVEAAYLERYRRTVNEWLESQVAAGRLRVSDTSGQADTWSLASVLMEYTSLDGIGDCIHLATAILEAASILVTGDQHLQRCAKRELLQEGEHRRHVLGALAHMTGVEGLTIDVLSIHEAHVAVERAVAGIGERRGRE